MTKRDSEKGFTLLELVISIALLGIIVVIVTGVMRLSWRSVEAGEKRINVTERFRTSLSIIASQIESQMPLTFDDNGTKKYYFKGDNSSLTIATNYSIWVGQRGYAVVSYRVEEDREGKKSIMAAENIMEMEQKGEVRLLDSLDSISFEYFSRNSLDEQGTWQEQWTDETMLPARIRMSLAKGNRRISLTFPVRVQGEAGLVASQIQPGGPRE